MKYKQKKGIEVENGKEGMHEGTVGRMDGTERKERGRKKINYMDEKRIEEGRERKEGKMVRGNRGGV